jgi:hypothetical protein
MRILFLGARTLRAHQACAKIAIKLTAVTPALRCRANIRWGENPNSPTPTQANTNPRILKQMSRKLSSAMAIAVLLSFAAVDAQAFPLTSAPAGTGTPDITLVEGGCGPGWHRGEFGRCRPNGPAVVVVPAAPVVVAPGPGVVIVEHSCGPGLRWHPGRRRCWAW